MILSSAAVKQVIIPALFAIGLAGIIEATVQLRYHPGFWGKTTWLMHDQFVGEPFDRVELYDRLSHLQDTDPEILSVGDSSGFFSLQSAIVNHYTNGHKFLSLNTGANHAYRGYLAIAEYMLQRSPHLKYVVLYLFPQLLPQEAVLRQADLGTILYDDLVGLKSYVTPPSAAGSPYAKFRLFAGVHYDPRLPLANHVPSLQLWSTVDTDLGWLPEFDVRFNRVGQQIFFYSDTRAEWYNRLGLTDPSSIDAHLDDFYQAVHKYGAQLVIAFGPFPKTAIPVDDPYRTQAAQALARFQNEHPDVKFLFPLITAWGSEKFGIWNHIAREYSFLSSERLGRALNQLLTNPQSIKPFSPAFVPPVPQPPITARPLGPPDPNLVKPALALYGYTSTADKSYEKLISTRVFDLLAKEGSYRLMMANTRKRLSLLASQNVEFGIDFSQIKATPVQVSGLTHCNATSNTRWVHLGGTMIFTYKSRTYDAREPVAWPAESGIYIPLTIEDGVEKFDGYCPEPSMTALRSEGQ